MNNEIKEILDELKETVDNPKIEYSSYDNNYKEIFDNVAVIKSFACKQLLDYITNLQQEIKEANDSIAWWTNRFKAVERDNRELKQENERLKKRNEEIYKGYMAVVDELTEYAEENERLKEENIEIRQCLLIKRKSIPHKLTMDKSIEEILDMPTYEDYKSRCEKAIEYNKEIVNNYLEEDNCEYCDGRYATAKHNLNILQNEIKGGK